MAQTRIVLILAVAGLCGAPPGIAQEQGYDPPGRIGRVSYLTGSVSLLPVGETEWSAASLNYPVTTGDALWADTDSRAELHVGASAVQLAPGTSLALDAIEDNLVQLRLGQGGLEIRLRELNRTDTYEIDTPGGSVMLRSVGLYRIDVTPDGRRTTLSVRDGDADIMEGDQAYPVRPGTSMTLTGSNARPLAMDAPLSPDEWERWAGTRNQREDGVRSTQYVSRDLVGYEDLDAYGDWQTDPDYGPVWYPRAVAVGWVPYRSGRWVSVRPWGWTWVDDEAWGFAPFHYGRWANRQGRWCWVPGQVRARPVYAPALVAFVSGDGWGASLAFGAGGGVGWVPLGPQEVFVPAYHHSTTYIRNVNITSVNVTRVNVTQIDVSRQHYANRDVPGAVTAVPRDAFVGSRPVQGVAKPVRPTDLASVRVATAPVAAGNVVAAPARTPPPDRGNGGAVRRPPVELPRTDRQPGAGAATSAPRTLPPASSVSNKPSPVAPHTGPPQGGIGRGRNAVTQPPSITPPVDRGGRGGPPPPTIPPPLIPPTSADRGRGRGAGGPPRPVPPPVVPTPPPAQVPPPPPDRGRNRGGGGPPRQVPPPVVPTPPPTQVPPPPPPDRGRTRGGGPPTRPVPPPVVPTPPPPPDRGRTRGGGPPTRPVPPPVVPTPPPPPDRGRTRGGGPPRPVGTTLPPTQVPPSPDRSGGRGRPATPPPPPPPAPPPQSRGGRGTPPPDRGGKPPDKTRPDSGRRGGGGGGGIVI